MISELTSLDVGRELGIVIGGLVTAAFALARMSMNQQRGMADRLMQFYELALDRQDLSSQTIRKSLDVLTESVQENTRVIRQSMENREKS